MEEEKKLRVITVDPDEIDKLKRMLHEVCATRSKLEKTLEEKPFLNLAIRKKFKHNILLCEAKITQMRSRLTTLEVCSKLTQDSLEKTTIPKHYQDRK